jgi:hypothetical protein
MTRSHSSGTDDDYSAEDAPEYQDLEDFADSCPVTGWRYEGNQNGGEQFSWQGYANWRGPGGGIYLSTVKFHIHVTGTTWNWGGMWVEGWYGVKISINGEAPKARPHLTTIIAEYLRQNGLPQQPS